MDEVTEGETISFLLWHVSALLNTPMKISILNAGTE
jgi:hypothetical protein